MTQQGNPQTYSTQGTQWIELTNNQTDVLNVVCTLANPVINLEYYLNGNPVTTGITGNLAIQMQWGNGRKQAVTNHALATTDEIKLNGVCSKLYLTASSLVGCDKIVVNATQYINNLGG